MKETYEFDENTYYVEELIKARDSRNTDKVFFALTAGLSAIASCVAATSILGTLDTVPSIAAAGILAGFVTGSLFVGFATVSAYCFSQHKKLAQKSGLEVYYENILKNLQNESKKYEKNEKGAESEARKKSEHEFDGGKEF